MTVVVDTSALVAILEDEPEAIAMSRRIGTVLAPILPASCYLEAVMVMTRRRDGRRLLDDVIARFSFQIVPVDEAVVRRAADAFERYGKGRHAAGLNFGDCLSYAVAQERRQPLLFKGGDFARTDVAIAA